jgi:uncharacterized protein YyaL (SSP411 family)
MSQKSNHITDNSQDSEFDHPSLPGVGEIIKLPADGGSEYNRLIFENSPYLLQHAANPVDWYPWGEEAFRRAVKEDKPVFLSIGYSTCHWCHVMERESFEDSQVAALLNETFIPIKVDREERPDVDQIYMTVCQALTGTGGWPLTVILTPDKLPFFAGTYFPKETRFGRTGLVEIISKIDHLWQNKRDELLESADGILDYLQQNSSPDPGKLDRSVIDKAYQQLRTRFDPVQGGFGTAPKFPAAHNLVFLLRYWHQTGENQGLEMVDKTLQKMRLGGIFDQIGYGFHRYSTDASWFLPHFEKMLYDQALLVMAYLEGYQATGKIEYSRTAREVLEYILRDMTSPEGGFYSAEDADSEGEEGLFYLWTPDEFRELLGDAQGNLFGELFNLEEGGNFYDESSRKKTGRSIAFLKEPFKELAVEYDLDYLELRELWENARQQLFDHRKKRIHPLKDDKILTDWNGLMIAALAKAASALDEPAYATAAQKAVDFIWERLRDQDGRLIKRYRNGVSGLPAHLDDYAFLVWGLIELYGTNFNPVNLKQALELTDLMLELFWDENRGGLFLTAADQSDLIVRSKEIYDGALPSGNSVAASNLVRLGRMTSNLDYENKAGQIADAFARQVSLAPQGYTQLLSAVMFSLGPAYEVVVSGDTDSEDTKKVLTALQRDFSPNKVLLFRPEGDRADEIVQICPFLENQTPIDGKATVYVCQDYACQEPTTDIDKVIRSLHQG